jgi:hypothetical protein
MVASKSRTRRKPLERESRWTPFQKLLGYLLLGFWFMAMLVYVSQSIEMKNVAYTMRDLMERKQGLLEEKHRLEVAILEKQSFKEIEASLSDLELPLGPGPRLKIVLNDDFSTPALQRLEPADDEGVLRHWLGRMNQAQAMVTGRRQRKVEWRAPIFTEKPNAEARMETPEVRERT